MPERAKESENVKTVGKGKGKKVYLVFCCILFSQFETKDTQEYVCLSVEMWKPPNMFRAL